MLGLYNTALLPLRAALALWVAWVSRDPSRRIEWAERCARRLPRVSPGGVWIHGASIGEARIVRSLTEALRRRRAETPVSVSAYTTTGRQALPAPPVADAAFFVPLDFRGFATRLLGALQPAVLTLVETELWPNLLDEAHEAGASVVLLNGRLSSSRMRRYRRFASLYRPLLARIARVGARSEEDADRFAELGVPGHAITVTGNVKYDLPVPTPDSGSLPRRLGAPDGRPLLVAGSTASGEEEPVLRAFAQARRRAPGLLLALAPRHPERSTEVSGLIHEAGLSCVRLSSASPVDAGTDVLLIDTVGDLPSLYGAARVAFVGGSLVPIGGHNVLEPAGAGVPVLFGPHMHNFAEPAAALEGAGGGRRVRDADELAEALADWLEDRARRDAAGRAARGVVEANRGALERSVALLVDVLDTPRSSRAPGAA